jgi:hypothetical protein
MTSLPGQVTGQTYSPINVLSSAKGFVEGQGVIDASKAYDGANTNYEDELRPGTPMARITSSKLWVPCKRTSVATGGGATAQAIPVVNARAFRVGDVISVGADSGKTIASINYASNTITVSDSAFTFADGEAVIVADGSQTCLGILNEFVKLKDVHFDGLWRNKPFAHLILAGEVDYAQILGDLAAIRGDANAKLAQILWNDTQGQV